MPEVLGPNPAGNDVWIEIQGLVKGHHPKAEYRFDRTIESLILFLHNNKWRSIPDFYKAPGTPDNKDRDDEDTKPDNDHIYVVDGPGLGDPPVDRLRGIDDIKRITQCVKIMNATESLKVKVGNSSWNTVISAFDWFVIIWLERDKNGAWQMNVKKSGAAPGSAGPLFPLKDGGFEPPAFNN